MSRAIARESVQGKVEKDEDEWKAILGQKVPLLAWFAINDRGRFSIEVTRRRAQHVVRVIETQTATRDISTQAREDIDRTDEQLLELAALADLSARKPLAHEQDAAPSDGNLRETAAVTDPPAWHADAQWALEQWEAGAFDNVEHDFVAVYDKDMLGTGDDPTELKEHWSRKLGVPFQRIFVKYVGTEE
jgi:hypothetical protein